MNIALFAMCKYLDHFYQCIMVVETRNRNIVHFHYPCVHIGKATAGVLIRLKRIFNHFTSAI